MEKETIEEAANNWIKNTSEFLSVKNGFIEGAKWQADRMYSEEDMRKCWDASYNFFRTYGSDIDFNDFIEQFKKK